MVRLGGSDATLTLDLKKNETDDEGMKQLAEARRVNTTLRRLEFDENDIGGEGAKELRCPCPAPRRPL